MQIWWSLFGMRDIPASAWTFGLFALVLLQTVVWYLLAALVLPDFSGAEPVDLRAHYFAHRKLFFGLFVAAILISLTRNVSHGDIVTDRLDIGFQLVFLAMSVACMSVARDRFHKAMCVIVAAFTSPCSTRACARMLLKKGKGAPTNVSANPGGASAQSAAGDDDRFAMKFQIDPAADLHKRDKMHMNEVVFFCCRGANAEGWA
ncbi:MAG: hypothetical protein QM741_13825 [Rudaea sp.]|uniref:hypothetical protein n=1 Tax=Rudaea sp. TaxID=2136325 RepID=UPI0039E27A73